MNIYFLASSSQRATYGKNYQEIVNSLQKLGHKVIYHVTIDTPLSEHQTVTENQEMYSQIIHGISESDLIVAEISFPSTLNVGHTISVALEKGKPVIGLYIPNKQSNYFLYLKSDKFLYQEYTLSNLTKVLKDNIAYAQDTADTRFNFIISSSLLEYLDWIAINNRVPRSVYLRKLIEVDMAKNKDYKP
ncbi:MAG: hypothetical protein Q8L51_03865 [Candidatus Amesbacteria bacterium]|nr:hypothetical protein [Candidatus Amesbacteria bacterium]